MLHLIYKISSSNKGICIAYKADLEFHLELNLFLQLQLDYLALSICSVENNSK